MSAARPSRRYATMAKFLLCGLLSGVIVSHAASAETASSRTEQVGNFYAAYVAEAAQRFDLPAGWILAVMHAESANDPDAISHAGAMGLMQIMPATWAELRSRHGLGHDPYDPRDNILAGTAYLRALLDRYGSIEGMLAAYNAGPGRYDAHLETGRALPEETRAYVASLLPRLGRFAPPGEEPAAPVTIRDWRDATLFVPRSGAGRDTGMLPPRAQDGASTGPYSGSLHVERHAP